MKNLEKNTILYGKELESALAATMGSIRSMVESQNLVWNHQEALDPYYGFDYLTFIRNASKRSIKRLNRQLYRFNLKRNRSAANRLFHFIKAKMGPKEWIPGKYEKGSWTYGQYKYELPTLKILPSLKEQKIQAKRKEWKRIRDAAEEARLSYVKEKGDFYKRKINQNLQLETA